MPPEFIVSSDERWSLPWTSTGPFTPRLNAWFLFNGLLIALMLLMAGSSLLAFTIPPAPADGIRDDARVMSAEGRGDLAAEMRKFEQRTGISIMVDTNTYLEANLSLATRCRLLLDQWLGGRPGAVFCVNRTLGPDAYIVFSQKLFERYPEPDLTQAAGETKAAMAKVSAPENRLPVGVRVLMGRLDALEKAAARRGALFHRRDLEMMAGFAGFLLAAGAVTALIVRQRHRVEQRDAVKHHFPDVEVAQRLGAPSGGGVVAEVGYSPR